jgi:ABC-type branched-subunit amino acid transport system ATPase component
VKIVRIEVHNFKSFKASASIEFASGLNVIIGENNVGKSALAEALSLTFGDHPHRSVETLPDSTTAVAPSSRVQIVVEIGRPEVISAVRANTSTSIPISSGENLDERFQEFNNVIKGQNQFVFTIGSHRTINHASFPAFRDASSHQTPIRYEQSGDRFDPVDHGMYVRDGNLFSLVIGRRLLETVYHFSAERIAAPDAPSSPNTRLERNAINLAQVLNNLQTSFPFGFQRFMAAVRFVLPQISQITIPPSTRQNGHVHILVWDKGIPSNRPDLATPLTESGTGIGQILAMLYVVLTSETPRVIIVDEPHSFLHPGAVRRLFQVFREQSHHQYIITTHSPTAIASSQMTRLFSVSKPATQSEIKEINLTDVEELRSVLFTVGTRLSDVFGADSIMWVEGATEELCFPLIFDHFLPNSRIGTSILGLVNTGDLDGKQGKTAAQIYERLSKGDHLMPTALAFILDRERKTDSQIDELKARLKEKCLFLSRVMFENYLLNINAIAHLLGSVKSGVSQEQSVKLVEGWIKSHQWEKKFYKMPIPKADQNHQNFLTAVHAGKFLNDLLWDLAQTEYDKIRHGEVLTRWILTHSPTDLEEIGELLKSCVKTNS